MIQVSKVFGQRRPRERFKSFQSSKCYKVQDSKGSLASMQVETK